MKLIITNELKYHEVEIQVKEEITDENFDEWLEKMEEFSQQDYLQDMGIYEFDGWDLDKSFLQINDENDDWLENFNKVVEIFKNKVQ